MDIDQRLERLVERHEALAQSVELMVHEHRQYEAKNQTLLLQMMEGINALVRIANSHEQRISDLEDRPQ